LTCPKLNACGQNTTEWLWTKQEVNIINSYELFFKVVIKNQCLNMVNLGVYNLMTDTQVFIALLIAFVPGILAFRLATELYK